jgi:hypothetical protein
MPFDWLYPVRVNHPERRVEAYRRELQHRAALLYRLGYDEEKARARLLANVGWDFEVGGARPPLQQPEIEAIVKATYRRRGEGESGGDPVVD